MIGPEQLAAGERAEIAGDFLTAAAAYRAVADAQDERLAAEAQFCLGRVTWRQGRFEGALLAFENALALATRARDLELWARVENGIGAVHYARGEFAAARRAYAASLARTTDDGMRGKIVLNLGVIENIEGQFRERARALSPGLRLLTQSGDAWSATLAVHNRGMVEADLRQWDAADASFLEALRLATESGNREMIAKTLVNRSEVLVERGALAEAIDDCERALAIYSDVGDEVGRGEALRWKGHALGRGGARRGGRAVHGGGSADRGPLGGPPARGGGSPRPRHSPRHARRRGRRREAPAPGARPVHRARRAA